VSTARWRVRSKISPGDSQTGAVCIGSRPIGRTSLGSPVAVVIGACNFDEGVPSGLDSKDLHGWRLMAVASSDDPLLSDDGVSLRGPPSLNVGQLPDRRLLVAPKGHRSRDLLDLFAKLAPPWESSAKARIRKSWRALPLIPTGLRLIECWEGPSKTDGRSTRAAPDERCPAPKRSARGPRQGSRRRVDDGSRW
jgi:hypothetical protein